MKVFHWSQEIIERNPFQIPIAKGVAKGGGRSDGRPSPEQVSAVWSLKSVAIVPKYYPEKHIYTVE